ncbi:uroporphyrinogen decarboxylase [Striga asiatica]|uniref:Uroporphyrinogen decarboxylase n=1 Tax=Striga asiatica TaxID=4170 RepID=A0A5A7NVK0_STRAF|nr:uroporphyrinogen decarboxylase [Striga asiatica]
MAKVGLYRVDLTRTVEKAKIKKQHPQFSLYFFSSPSSNAETGKDLESPVGVENVIFPESGSLIEISEIVTQIRSSLLFTPVTCFIRRSWTNAVTSVSYHTLRPMARNTCVLLFFCLSQTNPVASL